MEAVARMPAHCPDMVLSLIGAFLCIILATPTHNV